ncbi:MAG: MBL fold metallo-hydrolase [Clostridia bacterium]|nr:MBL fold metallo-hydrolase [Clostridia bacterium]
MKVIMIEPDGFACNSYILTEDGVNAVVIDPGQRRVLDKVDEEGLICKYVLLTHGHYDHVGGCRCAQAEGAQIICPDTEKDFIFSKENEEIFEGARFPSFEIDRTVKDGEEFTLCGITFRAIYTPGHTAGSMSYITGDCIFSGDTLFNMSVGRTDLPTGDTMELLKTLAKFAALEGDYKVYPGHGSETTLKYEKANNPYLRFKV